MLPPPIVDGPRPAESEDAPSKAKTGSKSTPTSPARPDDERHVRDTVTSRAQFDTSSRKRLSSVSNVQDRAPAVVERMARAKGRTDADWRSIADGLGAGPDETEMDAWMRLFERHCAADFEELMMLEVRAALRCFAA